MASAAVNYNEQMRNADDAAAFLQSLEMRLSVSGVTADNRARGLQLLQKTNQFNVTTRRHSETEMAALIARGAIVGAFSYTDKFGPQGIIGLVILLRGEETVAIETWLMSCRVLNRGVEMAMFEWIRTHSSEKMIAGEYIATEKNRLVSDLFDKMGFSLVAEHAGRKTYEHIPTSAPAAEHYLEIIYEQQT